MSAASSVNGAPPEPLGPRAGRPSIPLAVAGVPHGAPRIGGLVPYSSVDWPDMLAAVVFIAGCPWRCSYCHNPHLQSRAGRYAWNDVLGFLRGRRGLLDAVVFSGGEPLAEPRLPDMVRAVQAMGFRVALHTAGIYPARLRDLLPRLDWVGLDIKTDAAGYDALVGRSNSHATTQACLDALLAGAVEFECRTTWSPEWLGEPKLLALARALAARGVRQYAVQNHRATPDAPPTARLSAAALGELEALFPCFSYR